MAKIDFIKRIQLTGDIAIRSRIFYDIWWFYEGKRTRPKILKTMNCYSEFFRFDSYAHFFSLVVNIVGLFEHRKDTINFNQLLNEGTQQKLIKTETINKIQIILQSLSKNIKKAQILRHNLFAHRSNSLSFREAFKKAAISSNDLSDLIKNALKIANLLLLELESPEKVFHDLTKEDLKKLLTDLKNFNN